jgi:hypothetical protein
MELRERSTHFNYGDDDNSIDSLVGVDPHSPETNVKDEACRLIASQNRDIRRIHFRQPEHLFVKNRTDNKDDDGGEDSSFSDYDDSLSDDEPCGPSGSGANVASDPSLAEIHFTRALETTNTFRCFEKSEEKLGSSLYDFPIGDYVLISSDGGLYGIVRDRRSDELARIKVLFRDRESKIWTLWFLPSWLTPLQARGRRTSDVAAELKALAKEQEQALEMSSGTNDTCSVPESNKGQGNALTNELDFDFNQPNAEEKWEELFHLPQNWPRVDVDMYQIRIVVDDLEKACGLQTPALAWRNDDVFKERSKNQRVVLLFDGRMKVFVENLENKGWSHVHKFTAKFRIDFIKVIKEDFELRAMHPFHFDESGLNVLGSRASCIPIDYIIRALKKLGHHSVVIQEFGQKCPYELNNGWFQKINRMSYTYFKREVEANRPVQPNYFDIGCERSDRSEPMVHQFYWKKKDLEKEQTYRHKSVFRNLSPDHAPHAGWIRFKTGGGTIRSGKHSMKGPIHGTLYAKAWHGVQDYSSKRTWRVPNNIVGAKSAVLYFQSLLYWLDRPETAKEFCGYRLEIHHKAFTLKEAMKAHVDMKLISATRFKKALGPAHDGGLTMISHSFDRWRETLREMLQIFTNRYLSRPDTTKLWQCHNGNAIRAYYDLVSMVGRDVFHDNVSPPGLNIWAPLNPHERERQISLPVKDFKGPLPSNIRPHVDFDKQKFLQAFLDTQNEHLDQPLTKYCHMIRDKMDAHKMEDGTWMVKLREGHRETPTAAQVFCVTADSKSMLAMKLEKMYGNGLERWGEFLKNVVTRSENMNEGPRKRQKFEKDAETVPTNAWVRNGVLNHGNPAKRTKARGESNKVIFEEARDKIMAARIRMHTQPSTEKVFCLFKAGGTSKHYGTEAEVFAEVEDRFGVMWMDKVVLNAEDCADLTAVEYRNKLMAALIQPYRQASSGKFYCHFQGRRGPSLHYGTQEELFDYIGKRFGNMWVHEVRLKSRSKFGNSEAHDGSDMSESGTDTDADNSEAHVGAIHENTRSSRAKRKREHESQPTQPISPCLKSPYNMKKHLRWQQQDFEGFLIGLTNYDWKMKHGKLIQECRNNCFINATLQCLVFSPCFAQVFMNNHIFALQRTEPCMWHFTR